VEEDGEELAVGVTEEERGKDCVLACVCLKLDLFESGSIRLPRRGVCRWEVRVRFRKGNVFLGRGWRVSVGGGGV